jgi:hypothetical protein
VPLSRDAAAMSLGHFLEVSFGARHLSVGSRPLHAGYARYFGQGNSVACFLWERVGPVQVRLKIFSSWSEALHFTCLLSPVQIFKSHMH